MGIRFLAGSTSLFPWGHLPYGVFVDPVPGSPILTVVYGSGSVSSDPDSISVFGWVEEFYTY